MKNKALEMIETLQSFLLNIKSINEHPYSKGVNVSAVITDLDSYFKELKSVIENIEMADENQKDILEDEQEKTE